MTYVISTQADPVTKTPFLHTGIGYEPGSEGFDEGGNLVADGSWYRTQVALFQEKHSQSSLPRPVPTKHSGKIIYFK